MKQIISIPFHEIDLSDETFSTNFLADVERLRSSIQEVGQIEPVLLREKHRRYQIVAGFRRVSVFQELKIPEIEARVYGEKERDAFTLFSIALHENLATRDFNAVEKAIALDKLVHLFGLDRSTAIRKFLPLFSLETSEKILDTFLSLARMEEDVKRYVVREEVSRSNVRRLAALSTDDRRAVINFVSPLKLGENRLREILVLLDEISRRDQRSVSDLTADGAFQSVLTQKGLTPSQRTEKVKRVLTDLRYPRLREREAVFEGQKKKLNLPSCLRLDHAPYFESRGLRMAFDFETLDEYESILQTLSDLAGKKDFEELLDDTREARREQVKRRED